jgi:ferredoxin, 2Fe-2S
VGGENPYIDKLDITLPKAGYQVTFLWEDQKTVVQVDPQALPSGDGEKGALLAIALKAGVKLDHACGGVCACSTCHVIVKEGLDSCNESTDDEEDMLDMAAGLEEHSRLACQCVPDGTVDVVVEIPGWNRNAVSEEH